MSVRERDACLMAGVQPGKDRGLWLEDKCRTESGKAGSDSDSADR